MIGAAIGATPRTMLMSDSTGGVLCGVDRGRRRGTTTIAAGERLYYARCDQRLNIA